MLTGKEEIAEYQKVLDEGSTLICKALGVDPEFFEDDKADFDCYLDCFKEAAKLLDQYGIRFNHELGVFDQVRQD